MNDSAFEKWYDSYDPRFVPTLKQTARDAWEACKREVLKTLENDWKGLDLSINSCDKHYIEKIKEL